MGSVKSVVLVLLAMFSVAASAENKIAVVDIGAAIFNSDVAKARVKQLESESSLGALQAEYEGKVSEVQALQKDADANGLSWTDEQKIKYKNELEYLGADLDLIKRKVQKEQKGIQQKILEEVKPTAVEQLDALVKEEGVDILLRSESVFWSAPASNLTTKLIDRINKANGAAK